MAELSKKVDQNIPGQIYVDWTCIYCGLCKEIAPTIFDEYPKNGWAYVIKQPENEAEMELAREAANRCPLDSIGTDGPTTSES